MPCQAVQASRIGICLIESYMNDEHGCLSATNMLPRLCNPNRFMQFRLPIMSKVASGHNVLV